MEFIIRATYDDLATDYEEVLKPFNYQIEEKIGWRGLKYLVATIEINSLEEMLKLKKAVKADIIILENEGHLSIEIYDDYRE